MQANHNNATKTEWNKKGNHNRNAPTNARPADSGGQSKEDTPYHTTIREQPVQPLSTTDDK
jgi:hypothetical protein